MKRFLVLAVYIVLSGCGERASTFDEKTGRYISTDDYHEREIERAIEKHDREREARK
jgi:uncharacterized protein YceK